MKRVTKEQVASVVFAIAFLVACGGDDDDAAPQPSSTSDVKEASEAACRLFTPEEISAALGGASVETGQPFPEFGRCDFTVAPATSAPSTSQFTVTLVRGPSAKATLEELSDVVNAQDVAGLGDRATFVGAPQYFLLVLRDQSLLWIQPGFDPPVDEGDARARVIDLAKVALDRI